MLTRTPNGLKNGCGQPWGMNSLRETFKDCASSEAATTIDPNSDLG